MDNNKLKSMKEQTKKLLESPIMEDFLIGIELLYKEEGIEYFMKYDTGSKFFGGNKHKPKEFKYKSNSTVQFIIIENISILLLVGNWVIGTLESRLKVTAWTLERIKDLTIHEINPIYP